MGICELEQRLRDLEEQYAAVCKERDSWKQKFKAVDDLYWNRGCLHENKSEWISVKDRLPDKEAEDFLEKYSQLYEANVVIAGGKIPTTLYYDRGEFFDMEDNPYNVLYWAPLPEMPEEEKTDMNEKKEIMETAEVRSMSRERFVELLEEIDAMSANTMGYKNDHLYAAVSEDRLHNFRQGAAITGTTPAQTALAYMAKHLSALIDKVQTNDFHDREDLAEKCQDIINYVKFVWLCANDELDWEAEHGHR